METFDVSIEITFSSRYSGIHTKILIKTVMYPT